MCVTCIQDQVDITEGITKTVPLHQCRGCQRYNRPPWVNAEPESRELMALCLKRIGGLSAVKLVDAVFVWTEPHSRRIRIKLTIEKEALNVKLQQAFEVEFVLENMQCPDCARSYTAHTWKAMVQVRQHVNHKKTFLYLEQVILKHGAHTNAVSVTGVSTGIDFGFADRSPALKFAEFMSTVVPTRAKTSKQLVSSDIKSNTFNYKFTISVEIAPICKEDLVYLPAPLAANLGSISPLVLVYRVSNYIYIVDPLRLQIAEISAEKYWKHPFTPLLTTDRLVEYTVLDVRPVEVPTDVPTKAARKPRGKRRRKKALGRIDEEDDEAFSGVASVAGGPAGAAGASVRKPGSRYGVGGAGGGASAVSSSMGRASQRRRRAPKSGSNMSVVSGPSGWGGRSIGHTSTISGGPNGKFLLAEAEIARTRDLGANDKRYTVVTHLGNVLKPGDTVLGYDLCTSVYNDADLPSGVELPDAVLVRKLYPHRRVGKKRLWKLKKLKMQVDEGARIDEGKEEREYEEFLQQVEDDPRMRRNMALFRDADAVRDAARASESHGSSGAAATGDGMGDDAADGAAAAGEDDGDAEAVEEAERDPTYPGVRLEEMLDDLTLGAGGAGGATDAHGGDDSSDDGEARVGDVAGIGTGVVPPGANPFAAAAAGGFDFGADDAAARAAALAFREAATAAEPSAASGTGDGL